MGRGGGQVGGGAHMKLGQYHCVQGAGCGVGWGGGGVCALGSNNVAQRKGRRDQLSTHPACSTNKHLHPGHVSLCFLRFTKPY